MHCFLGAWSWCCWKLSYSVTHICKIWSPIVWYHFKLSQQFKKNKDKDKDRHQAVGTHSLVALVISGQNPISQEYQIYPAAIFCLTIYLQRWPDAGQWNNYNKGILVWINWRVFRTHFGWLVCAHLVGDVGRLRGLNHGWDCLRERVLASWWHDKQLR